MEIEAYTSSFAFDIEEKSRSFQDSEMSYDDLINTILLDYKIYSFTQCMDRPMSIGRPLFQYKQTDYEFLRRVTSHLGLELNSDIINTGNAFYFGRPSGRSYEIEEDIDYTASLDVKKYKQSSVHNSDIHPTDFFYYEIKTAKVMEIGAKVVFRQKELYVYSYEAEYVRGELIFTYRLCRQNGIWQEKIYNDKLKGISLEGRVMEVSGEQVKLHLNIDETQNQAKAAWFRYAPPTGNLMYSMPIVGTNANLYFPSERSQDPMVIGCVRKNGGSCEKFSDVNNRYFSTESGNNLDMLPDAINFSRPGLSANFNDGSGITLSSSSSLSINAGYVGMFAGNVSIEGTTKIVAEKGESSSISLENDFYNSASIIMENGSDRASNEPFDDDPQNGVAEAKAAMEAAVNIAVSAAAAAIEGAIGKVGECISSGENESGNNNDIQVESYNSSKSGDKSPLESFLDVVFPATPCYAAEKENSIGNNGKYTDTQCNVDLRDTLNKPWSNSDSIGNTEKVDSDTSTMDKVKSVGYAILAGGGKFSTGCRESINWAGEHIGKLDFDRPDPQTGKTYRDEIEEARKLDEESYNDLREKAPCKGLFDKVSNASETILNVGSLVIGAYGAKQVVKSGISYLKANGPYIKAMSSELKNDAAMLKHAVKNFKNKSSGITFGSNGGNAGKFVSDVKNEFNDLKPGVKVTNGTEASSNIDDLISTAKSNPNLEKIFDGLKNAKVIEKINPKTGKMEPYMKQYQMNEDYKILLRKDIGGFNDHDPIGDHWNLEIQTNGGRRIYDLHVYVDESGNLKPFTDDNIYIPRKSPFK